MTADTEPSHPLVDQPIRVTCPADLVGAVPYLVGFTPRRSLVAMSLRSPRLRCGLVMRVDLPDGVQDAQDLCPLVEQVVEQLVVDDPEQVVLLVYDDQEWQPQSRPWQELVDGLELGLAVHGVTLREACYVDARAFWSYSCSQPQCCPREGTPLAVANAGPVATALVAGGRAPVRDREELRLRVAPEASTAAAVSRLAPQRSAELADDDPEAATDRVIALFAELVVRHRGAACGTGTVTVTDQEGALVLAGLADTVIRDEVAMRWVSWLRDPACVPDDHGAVTRVLQQLARMSDGGWAVAPLTLYALQCWHSGEGALANLAIERALHLDPGYRMALLVDAVLRAGIPPQR